MPGPAKQRKSRLYGICSISCRPDRAGEEDLDQADPDQPLRAITGIPKPMQSRLNTPSGLAGASLATCRILRSGWGGGIRSSGSA